MSKPQLTPQEFDLLKAALANPEVLAEWLDEMQYTACAGIIRFPELVDECTAHIFASSSNPLYAEVYRATNAGQKGLEAVYSEVSRREGSMRSAVPLAALASHPVTIWAARSTIHRLQRFVAWQYRQEKVRRKVA